MREEERAERMENKETVNLETKERRNREIHTYKEKIY
jgi:hypothetical protein